MTKNKEPTEEEIENFRELLSEKHKVSIREISVMGEQQYVKTQIKCKPNIISSNNNICFILNKRIIYKLVL